MLSKNIIELAKNKWFVPFVIFLMLITVSTSLGGTKDEEGASFTVEEQLEEICVAVSGGEKATVMLTYESAFEESYWYDEKNIEKRISGVAIVCDGGDDPDIRLKLHEIISSLYGLPSTRITVVAY